MMFTETTNYNILVHAAAADPDRPGPLKRKLRAFGTLQPGWSHGEGVPVEPEAIRVAEIFVDVATTLQLKADVFPGLHGDCAVAFYQGERSVEIIVNAHALKSFGLHVEVGSGFQFETLEEKDNASHSEVVGHIIKLVPEAWKLPAYSHLISLTGSSADFQMSSSSTLQESPLARLTGS